MSETKDCRKELYVGVYLEEVRKGKRRYDAENSARLAVEDYNRFFDNSMEDTEEPATDEETKTPEDQVRETVEELAKELEHNFLSVNYRTVGPPVACGKPGVCNHKDDRDRCCLLGTCGHQVPPRIRGAVGLDFGKEHDKTEEPSGDEELFCAERSKDCEYRLITDRCALPKTHPCDYRRLLKEPRKDGKIFLCDKCFDKRTCKYENGVGECDLETTCPRQTPIS